MSIISPENVGEYIDKAYNLKVVVAQKTLKTG